MWGLRIICCLYAIQLGAELNAQNLVPNPSFELYNTCPMSIHMNNNVVSWTSRASPDYFNSCSPGVVVGVPINTFGVQPAKEGNGYVGLISNSYSPFTVNYREYVTAQLTSPLVANRKYRFSVHVSLGDDACFAARIGAFFSDTPTAGISGTPLILVPQVISGARITDKNKWTLVEGFFVAAGGEKFITIGNFDSIANFTSLSSCAPSGGGYYYIDDAGVDDCTLFASNFLGNDTSFCGNFVPLMLEADTVSNTRPITYLWNNFSTSRFTYANTPGTYWVRITDSNCVYIDTVKVVYTPKPVLQLGSDTSLCSPAQLSLPSSATFGTYLWHDGMTTIPRTIASTGTYWLELTDTAGCKARDTIQIGVGAKVPVSLGPDTTLCKGKPITWDISSPGATYLWSTGSTAPSITVGTFGSFWGEVNNNGCKSRDSVWVNVFPLEPFSLGPDTAVCAGTNVLLNGSTPGATSYLWSTNAVVPFVSVSAAGQYWCEARQAHCAVRDTMNLAVNPYPVVNLGNDTTVCLNIAYTLNAANPGAAYKWSTGDTIRVIPVPSPGLYSVKVTKSGCASNDSVLVSFQPPPVVNLGNDTLLCEGNAVTFNAAVPGASYLWQDGSSSSSFTVTTAGKYIVRVSQGACTVLDSVLVSFAQRPVAKLGPDTSYCFNQPVVLPADVTGSQFTWQDGSSTSTYFATGPGLYWVKVVKSVCVLRDSVVLSLKPLPAPDLGTNRSVCPGDIVMLNAFEPGASYLWNDHSTASGKSVRGPGVFSVKVTNMHGCFASDTVSLDTFPAPVADIGKDSFICEGGTFEIEAGAQFASYRWQDGSTAHKFVARLPGYYSVTVIDRNGCSAFDRISLTQKPKPKINMLKVLKICEPDTLITPSESFYEYQWQDGTTSSSYHVTGYGIYTLTVKDSNLCATSSTFEVKNGCPGTLFVPNVFTPTHDGLNETFYPVTRNIKELNLQVYNRWGELMFETGQLNFGWDGRFKGEPAPCDVYAWRIVYTGADDDTKHLGGTVTLLK